MRALNVLSLADGIGCAYIALERAGIEVDRYMAAEIDANSIAIASRNIPRYTRLGDVYGIKARDEGTAIWMQAPTFANAKRLQGRVDLLACGSPCQGFSLQGKQLNFEDERSRVFFECLRIAHEVNPTYFLFENVCMKPEIENAISELLGVKPYKINSLDFGGIQSRKRLYWTNIPLLPYEPHKADPRTIIDGPGHPMTVRKKDKHGNPRPIYRTEHFGCATFSYYKGIRADGRPAIGTVEGGFYDDHYPKGNIRMLTPVEYERLQGLPYNYTAGLSKTHRYQKVGDGWHIDTVAHIFKGLKS